MTINKEQQEQGQQSLIQALSSLPGISTPRRQSPSLPTEDRQEKRARLLSTIQLALDITSDDGASFFESPMLVSSLSWPRSSDEGRGEKQ
jgi:hypothetical protein